MYLEFDYTKPKSNKTQNKLNQEHMQFEIEEDNSKSVTMVHSFCLLKAFKHYLLWQIFASYILFHKFSFQLTDECVFLPSFSV